MKKIIAAFCVFSCIFQVCVSAYDYDDGYIRKIYITHDDERVDGKFELMEKESVTFGIKTSPSDAQKDIKWRSSNSKIAKVDQYGKVTAVKKGTCTIYATSTVNKSVSDHVALTVTEYVRFPDRITVTPQENAVFETGKQIQFTADIYPKETTEREINWRVSGGASIDQNGVLTIKDKGTVRIFAYSKNFKTVGEYIINAIYGKEYFELCGTKNNVPQDRAIIIEFDSDVSSLTARSSIFASCDETGNGDRIGININVSGNIVKVSPSELWKAGEVYIFIKDTVSDNNGNLLGKNIKYRLKVREVKDGF